jgi:hypothetical protein
VAIDELLEGLAKKKRARIPCHQELLANYDSFRQVMFFALLAFHPVAWVLLPVAHCRAGHSFFLYLFVLSERIAA